MGFFSKQKKRRATHNHDTLSLTAEQIFSLPEENQQQRLDNISSDLRLRLKKELGGMIEEMVDTALDNTRTEMEQILRNELSTMLQERLDKLVEQAIKTHLTKPRPDNPY